MFSPDRNEGPGFVLIAGGVGITPMVSVLRTMADRDDRRPVVLLYACRSLAEATFADELTALDSRLDLTTVYILERPGPDWDGEHGFIDRGVLSRHLPERHERLQYFICGPAPMVTAVEDALAAESVPAERVHTERFNFV